MFDVRFARSHFPALTDDWALFDNAGGSVPLAGVIERVHDYMSHWQVQLGASYRHSATATALVAEGQRAMARLVNASADEVVLGPSSTMNVRTLSRALLPLFSPVIDLLFLSSLLVWGLSQFHFTHLPQFWTAADVQRSLVFFAGFMLIDFLTCVIAFALERHEDWSLLWPLLLQRFYYRQMMYVVLFRAVIGAVQGKSVGWRGVEAEVPAPVAEM